MTIAPAQQIAMPAPQVETSLEPQHNELRCKEAQKKAVAAIRSKEKTRQLVTLCAQVTKKVQKSGDWFAKYEKFFRSPVWKLVSDEAIRKAHFTCEYWRCTSRATHVHLLELPEEHLEPNFDWMNRDSILIALCTRHHQTMHGFVMKRIVPSNQPVSPSLKNYDPRVVADLASSPVVQRLAAR